MTKPNQKIVTAPLPAPPSDWLPLSEAAPHERVLVAGWTPSSGRVQGYWWWAEDEISGGRPVEHPRATHFMRPFSKTLSRSD
jgi:hypothetical protein